MERTYRIVSVQSASEAGRAIYCLLLGKEQTVRIVIERRMTWEVGHVVQIDNTFIEEHRESI